MGKLWIALPPFAPDYSGVCSALFELGGMVVIHDGGGCTGNYTGYDEPRWYDSQSAVFCSGLREMEAALGSDNVLIEKIIQAADSLKPAFIAILGSPVPMLIGTDMKGIAAEIEETTGLPCFGLDTTGLALYNKGVAMAECAIAARFIAPRRETQSGTVNLLGMTPLDFSLNRNAADLTELLTRWGYRVLARFDMGASLDGIAKAANAQMNLVVSQAGMRLARLLEQEYAIPYVAGLPMGESGAQVLREALEKTARDGQSRMVGREGAGERIVFIGEQMQGNAFRAAYRHKTGRDEVQVACIYGMDPLLAAPGDLDLCDEAAIQAVLENEGYHAMVADPLLGELMGANQKSRFFPFAHIGVSSKLYWDSTPVFWGEATEKLLEQVTP